MARTATTGVDIPQAGTPPGNGRRASRPARQVRATVNVNVNITLAPAVLKPHAAVEYVMQVRDLLKKRLEEVT